VALLATILVSAEGESFAATAAPREVVVGMRASSGVIRTSVRRVADVPQAITVR